MAQPAWGQTAYGFRIGANASTFSGTFAGEAEPERTLGLVAGSFARYALRNDLGFQVELLYSQKGAQFERTTTQGDAYEQTLQVTYLEVPVLVTYAPIPFGSLRPVLYGGGAIGFVISEQLRERLDDFEQTQESDALTSPDLGLVVGADVLFSLGALNALVGVRYTHGLRDLVNPETATRLDSEAYTRTVGLTLGFLF